MRKTFGQLVTTSQDYVSDPSETTTADVSDSKSYLKTELNNGVRVIYSLLKKAKQTQRTQTTPTEEDSQFYKKPIDYGSFESATVLVGSTYYPITLITSSDRWNWLNAQSYSTNPARYIYIRRDDYGIWPTPPEDDLTITLTYNYLAKDMYADDYNSGTVATTQNDATITGTTTVWTSTMVDRWFFATTTSGTANDAISDFYKVLTFTSATSIELNTVYETPALSGASYIIGESPEIPSELHMYLPHFSAGMFYAGSKRNKAEGQAHLNFFWTGDFKNNSRRPSDSVSGVLGYLKQYSAMGEGNTGLVNRKSRVPNPYDERFRSGVITI